jgi:hypothetical protein
VQLLIRLGLTVEFPDVFDAHEASSELLCVFLAFETDEHVGALHGRGPSGLLSGMMTEERGEQQNTGRIGRDGGKEEEKRTV